MFKQYNSKKRIKLMAIIAVFMLLLFLALKLPWVALGLAIGAGVGIFNFWLVNSKTFITKKKDGTDKNPLGSYLIRLVIAGTIITFTGIIRPDMLLGAILGLTLEMQTYLWDAARLIFSGK